MKTFYLIRHCKASGQEPEAALTPEGVNQSQALCEFLGNKGIETIVSSPFARAIHTIKPFADQSHIEIIPDSRLSERVLSTVAWTDWMDKLKQTFENEQIKFEGGESSAEAAERGLAVINDCMSRKENKVAIVTHGNLLSLIIRNFMKDFGFQDWQALSNPDVYELKIERDQHGIERIWG
jgi:2,3-bisphosphoglycerate-dependent phosphoglycerate mutase